MVGGLGCGKSSILYAIDFAFFGEPLGRSYDYLLREGTNSGKVTVQFILNGKTYTLTRGLKRRGKGINQDMEQLKLFEEEKLLAASKNEAVEEQLKTLTGFDREIFREIVWVRQEHLKELLDISPRDRQKRLDQLFGLADYETAWSNIAGIKRDFETEKKLLEKDFDVVGVTQLREEHDKAVVDLSNVENELQDLAKKAEEAEIAHKESLRRLQGLEELRKQSEEMRKKEAELRANVAGMEDACNRLDEEIRRKTSTVDGLEQRLNSMKEQYNSSFTKLQEIGLKLQNVEDIKGYLVSLDEQITQIRGEQESIKKELQTAQRRVFDLENEKEARCPLCLQSLPEDYKKGLIEHIKTDNIERGKQLTILQRNAEELQKTRVLVNAILSDLQLLVPRMGDLEKRIGEEREALNKMLAELDQKRRQTDELRNNLNRVRDEAARFDVSQLEDARTAEREAFLKISEIKRHFEVGEQEKKRLLAQLEDFKSRLDRAQEKIERLEKVNRLLEVTDDVRDAYRSIQPRLRGEFVRVLGLVVQHVLDDLMGEGSLLSVSVDESYTPLVSGEEGFKRDVSFLSGGERTLVAFAYRLGLGELIMQSRTGHGLYMLFLDEPTESLGREDGSVDRLAEAIGRLKVIEQIIAVTHSDAFAEKAEHVVRLVKETGESRVIIEK
jgi:exonuclease SbcC